MARLSLPWQGARKVFPMSDAEKTEATRGIDMTAVLLLSRRVADCAKSRLWLENGLAQSGFERLASFRPLRMGHNSVQI
jgi:hypothetical protein